VVRQYIYEEGSTEARLNELERLQKREKKVGR